MQGINQPLLEMIMEKYNQIESSAPPLGVVKQKDKSIYNINKMKLNGSRFYAFTDGLVRKFK